MLKFKELAEGKFDKSAVKDHIKSMSPEMFTKLYGKTKAEIKDDIKEAKIDEAAPFKKLEHAVAYATDKVKTHRDNLDGIEVYKHKDGGYDVNHTMNSSGRNSLNKTGAKHLGTVYKDKPTNIKEEAELEEQAPVAPVPDKKYIKGTPENKAYKATKKPINGMPTNQHKEEIDMTDEQMLEELKSLSHEQLLELSQQLDELKKTTVKSYITKKMDSIYKTSAPPSLKYVKKTMSDLQRAHDRNTGVKPTSEEVEHVEEGILKGTAEVVKQAVRVPYRAVKRVAGAVLDTAHDVGDAAKNIKKKFKEQVELEERFINGREYASHGLMHPDHAKMDIHKVSGDSVDFYASKTGDKMHGKVTKNDGKQVHIQAHKELGDGKVHKFKVSSSLPKQNNEEFENGELETSMKTYKDFLTSIDEALWPGTPEYKKKFPDSTRGKVGSETKTSSGTSTVTASGVKHERDYDKAEKETTDQPTGNAEKRGRGRPAGSKSGARR